eukprot:688040-Pyramimonas_sp.AAC.2
MSKFYELFVLGLLLDRCRRVGFPSQVSRRCVFAYQRARFLLMYGSVNGPWLAIKGVIAGCSIATTLVRIYLVLDPGSRLTLPRSVTLDAYIDDCALTCMGSVETVVRDLASASRALHRVLALDCKCSLWIDRNSGVAADAACLISSSAQVAHRLRVVLGSLAGITTVGVANLGIGDAQGKPRCSSCRGSTAKKRVAMFNRRVKRPAKLKPELGKRCKQIFTAGPLPGVLYGVEVHGCSDGEVHHIRRSLGRAMQPSAGGRSLAILMISEYYPARLAAVAPVVRWGKEVWITASKITPLSLSFAALRSAWSSSFSRGLTWRSCGGPVGA